MRKSDIKPMPEYFDRYIALADDVDHLEALKNSLNELENLPIAKWKALGDRVYAPGKWTAKDILQHYIDVERVFAYRITAIARGDKQGMLSFDEEDYARNTYANNREIEDLLDELLLVRKGTIALFNSLTDNMLLQIGNTYNGNHYSPLALAYIIAGHQRWHFRIIEERYFPMINDKFHDS